MSLEAKIIAGVSVLVGLVVIGSAVLLGDNTAGTLSDTSELVRDYNYRLGEGEAKVTLVEFADFQCPACGAFYSPLKQISSEFKDQVSFVYRHFPLPSHQHAEQAALVSEAAGEQGKFWEMQAKIYENQRVWSSTSNPQSIFEGFAQELGLDIDEFQKSVSEKEYLTRVKQDAQDGAKLGVNSTPTLFINGQKYTGGLSYGDLKKSIELELKK
jgi:protein-disulfide isomerase